ncbi:MAG: acyl-CoA synthetase FdrA [Armatimonadota bacterium]|nr:acyl-CoA synthetase FdrA [Armatimonadota bacterium]
MPIYGIIRRSAYFDSVALMLAQGEARELPGVDEAGVVMATDANKMLLRDSGLDFAELTAAGPDDLVVVARAATASQAEAAVNRALEALTRRRATTGAGPETYRPRTIAAARRQLPDAGLALISVPGRFARPVAREAFEAGLHVLLFSDNVPIEHEIELKRQSLERGLLLMGPDCGTAIVHGAALGFANRVRQGRIGLVGAAGTGLQEVTSLIHRFGGGITHAIGTGGRDLSAAVGGVTMLQGLRALAQDPATTVIVLVSKPPAPAVAARLLASAVACGKPVVVNFIGATVAESATVHSAATLEDAARTAVRLAYGPDLDQAALRETTLRGLPAQEAGRLSASQRYVRGLFIGGTLCYEALALLRPRIGPVWSNTPIVPSEALDPVTRSREHTVIDMGGDEFTQGRLHPMLDPFLRQQRIRQEAADPETAVLLLDVVLGYGVHPDPAGALAPVLREACRDAQAKGCRLSIVGSVCGTDDDPQNAAVQREVLLEAGMIVEDSNARACRLAGLIAEARGSRGAGGTAPMLTAAEAAPAWPEIGPVAALLRRPPAVINVGLELFAESLQAQGVPVVSVDWRPPAGGKPRLMDLLDKLEG